MYAQDQSLVISNLAVSLCDTIIIVLCCTCQPFAALCVKLHGPIHGGLQHCVSDVQQKTAAGQQHGTALIYTHTHTTAAWPYDVMYFVTIYTVDRLSAN